MTVPEESKLSNLLYAGFECPEFRVLPNSELKLDDTLWHHLSLVRNWFLNAPEQWNHFHVACVQNKLDSKCMFIKIEVHHLEAMSLSILRKLIGKCLHLHSNECQSLDINVISWAGDDAMSAFENFMHNNPHVPSFSELEVYAAVSGVDV